jgi:mannose-6-phosphate isomerase-like protein (cupin superfamily)
MATDAGPWKKDGHRLIVAPSGQVTPKAVTPDFYQELDQDYDGFAGHSLIAVHDFEEDWSTWEMHPEGDEVVCLISGEIDFVFSRAGEEEVHHVSDPGTMIIVPQGVWHTARISTKSTLIFYTPGEGTLNADAPGS